VHNPDAGSSQFRKERSHSEPNATRTIAVASVDRMYCDVLDVGACTYCWDRTTIWHEIMELNSKLGRWMERCLRYGDSLCAKIDTCALVHNLVVINQQLSQLKGSLRGSSASRDTAGVEGAVIGRKR
jgi:hypothetical protein